MSGIVLQFFSSYNFSYSNFLSLDIKGMLNSFNNPLFTYSLEEFV